ncbi:MAG TPA: hypothetical protein DDY88_01690 [Actinobacteria bacterium]|nr:hypothetical protein [Actinomycetota bacterium]
MRASAGARRWAQVAVAILGALSVACLAAAPSMADSGRTLALGDSVMLGARAALQDLGVQKVDAKVSRQASTAPELLRERGIGLQKRIVIHLGTNGTFSPSICRSIMNVVGSQRRVYLVNVKVPRRWEGSNNLAIQRCAERYPKQVRVVDWHLAASRHPEWLYADGVHLRPNGARGFADLINESLRSDVSHPTFVTT